MEKEFMLRPLKKRPAWPQYFPQLFEKLQIISLCRKSSMENRQFPRVTLVSRNLSAI